MIGVIDVTFLVEARSSERVSWPSRLGYFTRPEGRCAKTKWDTRDGRRRAASCDTLL